MKLWLAAAASYAPEVDQLLLGLLLLSGAVLLGVFGLMTTFVWRYRHNSRIDRGPAQPRPREQRQIRSRARHRTGPSSTA